MITETKQTTPALETFEEAYNRLLANYHSLGGPGADMEWFEVHVKPLLKIAIPSLPQTDRPAPPVLVKWKNLLTREAFIDLYSRPDLDLIGA